MTDLQIMVDSELMMAEIVGITDDGVEFVDAYIPVADMEVVDSGRIVIPSTDILELEYRANRLALGVTKLEVR